jgi:hypothetical protein
MQKFSLAVAKIEMFRDDVFGAMATGFFYKLDNETFLVTNWHNVTGVDHQTGSHFTLKDCCPKYFEFTTSNGAI